MSLATRCPACGTTFKVVPDQLRISDGWVRCGRCSRVFDANDQMVDPALPIAVEARGGDAHLEEPLAIGDLHDAIVDVSASEAMPASPEDEPPLDDDLPWIAAPATDESWERLPSLDLDLGGKGEGRVDPSWSPAGLETAPSKPPASYAAETLAPVSTLVEDVIRPNRDQDSGEVPAPFLVRTPSEPSGGLLNGGDRVDPRAGESDFSFLGDSVDSAVERRRTMWRRIALATLALVAFLVLVSQVLARSHDEVVAHQPGLRPAVLAWCRMAGCTLSPLRKIDDITIEGSAFARQQGDDGYLLSFTLRNRSALPLSMPAIELSLLDSQERPVLRRVLRPADFAAPLVLSARGEHSAALPLSLTPSQTDALQPLIAGYHLDAFYP
ncbi:MAG: zinc-ribbon and DUF3426 domain-containing protein [Pseudomonadota bacterium]